jgi:hypothetical protein
MLGFFQFDFFFVAAWCDAAAPRQIFSAPPQPLAAPPLPLPVGLSGRIRSGSGIRGGPPGPARAVTCNVTVATPGGGT